MFSVGSTTKDRLFSYIMIHAQYALRYTTRRYDDTTLPQCNSTTPHKKARLCSLHPTWYLYWSTVVMEYYQTPGTLYSTCRRAHKYKYLYRLVRPHPFKTHNYKIQSNPTTQPTCCFNKWAILISLLFPSSKQYFHNSIVYHSYTACNLMQPVVA